MFSFALVSLFALGAFASPISNSPALSLSLSGPSSVSSLSDLQVRTTLTNTGSRAVKLLQHGTPLEEGKSSDLFHVTDAEGDDVRFTGIHRGFVLSLAVKQVGDEVYKTLHPGEALTTTHPAGSLYAFHESGEGQYEIVSTPRLRYVVGDDTPVLMSELDSVKVKSNTLKVDVSGDLKPRERLSKRYQIQDCADDQKSFIVQNLNEQVDMAQVSIDYLNANGAGDSLFVDYFQQTDINTVLSDYNHVVNVSTTDDNSGELYKCSSSCDAGVPAYTELASTGGDVWFGVDMIFCFPSYSELVDVSALCDGSTTVQNGNVAAGALLHEQTHYWLNTCDCSYGSDGSKQYATENPTSADKNADNLAYFSYETKQKSCSA